MMPVIPEEHLVNVCQISEGVECCRYIVHDRTGFCCAKHDELIVQQITRRIEYNAFIARGDNCEGLKLEENADDSAHDQI